jgi:hypothetical protein
VRGAPGLEELVLELAIIFVEVAQLRARWRRSSSLVCPTEVAQLGPEVTEDHRPCQEGHAQVAHLRASSRGCAGGRLEPGTRRASSPTTPISSSGLSSGVVLVRHLLLGGSAGVGLLLTFIGDDAGAPNSCPVDAMRDAIWGVPVEMLLDSKWS